MYKKQLLEMLPWAAAGSIASSTFATSLPAVADRPNIVIILVDDLGYSDFGCYGGEIERRWDKWFGIQPKSMGRDAQDGDSGKATPAKAGRKGARQKSENSNGPEE